MALLRLGKTKSGFPGRSGTLSRNLYPHERAIFLTVSSGFVSLLLMSAMRLLRSRRVNVSMPVRIEFDFADTTARRQGGQPEERLTPVEKIQRENLGCK